MKREMRLWIAVAALAALLIGVMSLLLTTRETGDVAGDAPHVAAPEGRQPDLTAVPATYRPEKVGFAVEAGDEVIPYRVMAIFALPGEAVELDVLFSGASRTYEAEAGGGTLTPHGETAWTWTAPPEPGLYPLRIAERETGEVIRLNAFVKVPYARDQAVLNGYRIGRYEPKPLRGDPLYLPPNGFVELTPENRDVLVAPHFTLGQFAAKQAGDYPKYLVLRTRLLLKLERILQTVNARGVHARTFHVMSGFRTPSYNRSIGNETSYSRHLFGGAADIFVDEDGDGRMDDLDGDGRVSVADARTLADLVEAMTGEADYRPLAGGMGVYDANPSHGPFVHVDVRGQEVRW